MPNIRRSFPNATQRAQKQLSDIGAKDAGVGKATRSLHEALVDQFLSHFSSSTRDHAVGQREFLVNQVADSMSRGKIDGNLRATLRYLATDGDWGAKVNEKAAALAPLLARALAPNALAIDFSKSGEKRAAIDVQLDGATVKGEFVFDYDADKKRLHKPRIEVGDKTYLVSDRALDDLLGRAGGVGTDHENSDRTKYLKDPEPNFLGLFDDIPSGFHGIVDETASGYKVMRDKDYVSVVDGEKIRYQSNLYYHDESVKLTNLE